MVARALLSANKWRFDSFRHFSDFYGVVRHGGKTLTGSKPLNHAGKILYF